jgi:hypothetical protein
LNAENIAPKPTEEEIEEDGKTESSPQGLERMKVLYETRLNELRQGDNPTFKEALRIAELVEEPNILSVYRLVEVFGPEVVGDKAAEAWTLFQEAKNRGPEAYVMNKDGTAVATKKGQPRTPGGVFFYLMRQYSDSLGLRWTGFHLPKLPGAIAHLRPKLKFNEVSPAESGTCYQEPTPSPSW